MTIHPQTGFEDFNNPPLVPAHTGRFFGVNGNHYAYGIPESIEKWEFSYTFNKWGAFVKHSGGKTLYTFPELAK